MIKAFLRAAQGILLNLLGLVASLAAFWLLCWWLLKPGSPQPEPVPVVVVIEGCQYFKLDVGPRYYYTLIHKGNCTNH